jgi:tetratricopeptide (TPR) repeat protein
MDFMSPRLFAFAFISLIAMSYKTAYAQSAFSVNNWKKDFKQSLKAQDNDKLLELVDIAALEKKAVPTCSDCDNKATLKKARTLFAAGKYDDALEAYQVIPKGNDLWLQAVEEKGWAHYRQGNPEKAMSQAKTLLSPAFAETVSPEAYFLQSLSQLKICDYKGVFETHELFKKKQKEHIVQIQQLSTNGMNENVVKVVARAESFPLKLKSLGEEALSLPIMFHKDRQLQSEMMKYKVSTAALEVLASAEPSSLQARLLSSFEKIKQQSNAGITARLQQLAQQETATDKKIITKMNLVEVEAIQRLHSDLSLNDEAYSNGKFKKTSDDELVFMDDGRPWIDELDKFEVISKSCPTNLRRKM